MKKEETKEKQLKKEKAEETVAEAPAKEETAKEPSLEEKLQTQLSELDDKYKRTLAEYDNFRKRTTKERESAFGDGKARAVSEFLPLVDNLARGASQENADEGVKMMHKQALEILEKLHVKACGQVGENFDPNFHNAVLHVDDESMGENVIAEVLACGYTMDDRLLRPAVVKVAN